MSARRRPFAELVHAQRTPSLREPRTPAIDAFAQSGARTRPRTTQPLKQVDGNSVRPNSARGVLRRLAKITAATSKRRTVTPSSVVQGKENIVPHGQFEKEDETLVKPQLNFHIEESIEEDESEILVAPTPSALLEDTDDDEDQPIVTFLDTGQRAQSHDPCLSHIDSGLQDEADAEDGNSTFLTEIARRAVSEEPTRMSRYSFGSIRMSDFGTELEIKRVSDRQGKLAEAMPDDDIVEDSEHIKDVQIGDETEGIRHMRHSSEPSSLSPEDDFLPLALGADDSFELNIPHHEVDEADPNSVAQSAFSQTKPLGSNPTGEQSDEDEGVVPTTIESAAPSRRQTLLESVAATASSTRPRKRLKVNQRGNMVPGLPSSLIKRIVNDLQQKANKRKVTLGKEHMQALEQATEWFFEQASEDLEAFSGHGRRKKRIDDDDVLLLMRRQRVLREDGELLEMARQWLPRDILNELDLPDRP
ncbi:hypothetical protein LTR51_000065 [Lithohypha guttulata]|nr:hypothetical protein LTR51_000065 [Lithohypha guttulata]